MDNEISNYIIRLRKSHGSQYSIIIWLEKWKRAIDKGKYFSVMNMDLSEISL